MNLPLLDRLIFTFALLVLFSLPMFFVTEY